MSVPRETFEALYASDPDPWGFESRWYERRKYALTLASLPDERYRSAFEPGCSTGVLSSMLAPRCDRLVCWDAVAFAARTAATRLASQPQAVVECRSVPAEWPGEEFDLVLVSELAYYFDAEEAHLLASKAVGSLKGGGCLVSVHWTGETDYPLSGRQAQQVVATAAGQPAVASYSDDYFVLDVWQIAASGTEGRRKPR